MQNKRSVIVSLILLVLVCSLYRVFPNRPWGFAPQIAMAIFGGAIFVKDKKWAFALPILSMFISDGIYQILYMKGLTTTPGFYDGQILNYVLIALMTTIGFFIKRIKVLNVLTASITAPTLYFIISNFIVWIGGGGWNRPKTFSGLMQCYNDGLPFYPGSLYSTIIFSAVLFGSYYFIQKRIAAKQLA